MEVQSKKSMLNQRRSYWKSLSKETELKEELERQKGGISEAKGQKSSGYTQGIRFGGILRF